MDHNMQILDIVPIMSAWIDTAIPFPNLGVLHPMLTNYDSLELVYRKMMENIQ